MKKFTATAVLGDVFFSGIFPVLGDVRRANNVKMVDDGKIAETRPGMKVRKWLAAYKED